MTSEDLVIEFIAGFSISKITNTVALLEAIIERSGRRHSDNLALQFCRENSLPRMDTLTLMRCLGKAANRKMLLANIDEDTHSKPTIIH